LRRTRRDGGNSNVAAATDGEKPDRLRDSHPWLALPAADRRIPAAAGFRIGAAKADEAECIRICGAEYEPCRKRTKRFNTFRP
jgi:hypothetical protein